MNTLVDENIYVIPFNLDSSITRPEVNGVVKTKIEINNKRYFLIIVITTYIQQYLTFLSLTYIIVSLLGYFSILGKYGE